MHQLSPGESIVSETKQWANWVTSAFLEVIQLERGIPSWMSTHFQGISVTIYNVSAPSIITYQGSFQFIYLIKITGILGWLSLKIALFRIIKT